MPREMVVAVLFFAASLAGQAVPNAAAGSYTFQRSCDTLSVDPFRVRLGFIFLNARGYPELCSANFEPISNDGSEIRSLQGCVATPPLTCEKDSTLGIVTFRITPCAVDYPSPESGALISDGLPASFRVTYTVPGGLPYHHEIVDYTGSEPTPIVPASWGRLKSIYR